MWQDVLTIFIASALINNFVFARYLGLCIFFGVTKKMETAVGMSFTFTGVMLIGTVLDELGRALATHRRLPVQRGRDDRAQRRDHRADRGADPEVHVRHRRDVVVDNRKLRDVDQLLASLGL